MRNVVAGANPVELRRGLERDLAAAVATLRSAARPVKTREDKAQVATASAHGDRS